MRFISEQTSGEPGIQLDDNDYHYLRRATIRRMIALLSKLPCRVPLLP
jgi:hypothetical protein